MNEVSALQGCDPGFPQSITAQRKTSRDNAEPEQLTALRPLLSPEVAEAVPGRKAAVLVAFWLNSSQPVNRRLGAESSRLENKPVVRGTDSAGHASASATGFHADAPSVEIERPNLGPISPAVSDFPDVKIVFIEKQPHLRFHAGQIAFPGGHIEAADSGPVTAALREAREETGMAVEQVRVLGLLPQRPIPRSGFAVTSVVGWSADSAPLAPGDLDEVVAVHLCAVSELLDPANRSTWVHPNGFSGPGFQVGDLYIWGFTAQVLDQLFTLSGWAQPWDAALRVPIPKRFHRS